MKTVQDIIDYYSKGGDAQEVKKGEHDGSEDISRDSETQQA